MALFTDFELKEFNSASLTGSYQNFGAALSKPAYRMEIFNDSDVDVYVSKDASTNDIRIPSGFAATFVGDFRWNTATDGVYILKKGDQLSIKQVTAAGTGFVTANISTAG